MIVKCLGNSVGYLIEKGMDSKSLANFRENVHLDEVGLVIGRHYVVFGVAFREGVPWYLICEDQDDEYPKPHFFRFFELIDDRMPPGWSFRLGSTNVGEAAFLPTYWARDRSYLEKLVDGFPEARVFFESLKQELAEWHSL
jgi:hypothetical protein